MIKNIRKKVILRFPRLSMSVCVLLMLLGSISCSEHLEFVRKTVKNSATLSSDSSVPTCSYSINFLYATGVDSVADRINNNLVETVLVIRNMPPAEAVDSFVRRFVADYRKDVTPFYLLEKHDNTLDFRGWYNYETNITTSVYLSCKGEIINYVADEESYLGGAHVNNTTKWLNFKKNTGTFLSLDDIMIEGYQNKLSELLIEALEEKCNVSSLDELHEKGYLNWTEMYPPQNFLIKEKVIEFLFNPYEIAPWSMGKTELTISSKKLKRLMKPIEKWT